MLSTTPTHTTHHVDIGPTTRAILDDYTNLTDALFAFSSQGRLILVNASSNPDTQQLPVDIVDIPKDSVHRATPTAPAGNIIDLIGNDHYLVYPSADGSLRFLDRQTGFRIGSGLPA